MQEQGGLQRNSQQAQLEELSSTPSAAPSNAKLSGDWSSWPSYLSSQPTAKGIWGPFGVNDTSSTDGGSNTQAGSAASPTPFARASLPLTNGTSNTNGTSKPSNGVSNSTKSSSDPIFSKNDNASSIFPSLSNSQAANGAGRQDAASPSGNTLSSFGAHVDPAKLLRKPLPSNSVQSKSTRQSAPLVPGSSKLTDTTRPISLPPSTTPTPIAAAASLGPAASSTSTAAPHNKGSSHVTGTTATSNNNNAGLQSATASNSPAVASGQSTAGQQSTNNVASDGAAANPPGKPVLKMKRTGQTFSLSTTTHTTSHQRTSSFSPKLTNAVKKASDNVPSKAAAGPSSAARPATGAQLPQRNLAKSISKAPRVSASATSTNRPTVHSSPRPSPAGVTRTGVDGIPKAGTAALGHESDGEIKYENDGPGKEALGNDEDEGSSDNETESDSDDELVELNPKGQSHQLFRAPDQESDDEAEYDGETEEESSSEEDDESSVADEPTVALPSANIQHQAAYPPAILDMATPDRPYTVWIENGSTIKASPAIFPAGYHKSKDFRGLPWVCSVRSCRLLYKTPKGLSNHFKFTHKRQMFNDNLDGTLSLVGSYTKKNEAGRTPPVVASKRPLDLNEPPMATPQVPAAHKALTYSAKVPRTKAPIPAVTTEMDPTGDEKHNSLPPPSADDAQRSEDNWNYIKPFLKVHDAIPQINWVKHVLPLPRVRDIKWNEARLPDHPYNDSHARDITALIVQITGVESPAPCEYCVAGKGPFAGCVMISPDASTAARASVLSCANCYYHCRQSLCSHCSGAVARRQRERISQGPGSYNVKVLTNVAHGKPVTTAANISSPSVTQLTPQSPSFRQYSPFEINPIENATSDRSYKVLKGKDGAMILLHGALIPEKYDLDPTITGHPWICPLRTCRNVFKKIVNLGSHFVIKHRGAILNDNLDGTLSQIGVYNVPMPGSNACPALIISQKAPDKSAPAVQDATIPSSALAAHEKQLKHKIVPKKPSKDPAQPTNKPMSETKADKVAASVGRKTWNYIVPYLPRPLKSIQTDSVAIALFAYPRLRAVQWRSSASRVLDDDAGQVAGLVLHLIGDVRDEEAKNGNRPCTNCVRGDGPFEGCHVLPGQATYDLHQAVRCCANCLFTHRKDACSVKSSWERRCTNETGSSGLPTPPVAEWANAAAEESGVVSGVKRPRLVDSDGEDGEPVAQRRRSERNQQPVPEIVEPEQPRRKIVTLSLNSRGRGTPVSTGDITPIEPRLKRTASSSAVPNAAAAAGSTLSALINAGQIQPDDLLEMEDWEIAPGHIRQTGVQQVNNIAFSKAYLETNKSVRVSRDVNFEVKTIKSGHSYGMDADTSRTRYCSLASGKLRVCIAGQPDFTIGPHGLFKVAAGMKARVQNRLYVDSVLHISTYAED